MRASLFLLTAFLLPSSFAEAAATLSCNVEKVALTDSSRSHDCGTFEFALPHDIETKYGKGACRGLELNTHLFDKGDHNVVQFMLRPPKKELGPNGNSGFVWVGFRDHFPDDFALQAIGNASNYVVRCEVK